MALNERVLQFLHFKTFFLSQFQAAVQQLFFSHKNEACLNPGMDESKKVRFVMSEMLMKRKKEKDLLVKQKHESEKKPNIFM